MLFVKISYDNENGFVAFIHFADMADIGVVFAAKTITFYAVLNVKYIPIDE